MGTVYFAYVLIVANSIIVSILIGFILVLKFSLKKYPASWHYALWLIMILKLSIPLNPLSLFNTIDIHQNQLFYQISTFAAHIKPLSVIQNLAIPGEATIGHKFPADMLFFIIWMAGTLFLSIRFGVAYFRFLWFIRRDHCIGSKRLEDILLECRKESFTARDVPIRVIRGIPTALVFGIFRPVLLIPVEYAESLDDSDLRLILYHELAHIRHHDTFWNIYFLILRILNWFNPLIAYGFRCLDDDREMTRDAEALVSAGDHETRNYGMLLLRLLGRKPASQNPAPASVAWISAIHGWKSRITRITHFRKSANQWGTVALSLFFLLMVIVLVAAGPKRRSDNIILPFQNDPAVVGTWAFVDSLYHPEAFDPGHPEFHGKPMMESLTFLPGGFLPQPYFTWTKGYLIHKNDKTAMEYYIQNIHGKNYLFLRNKGGDYIFGSDEKYYSVFIREYTNK